MTAPVLRRTDATGNYPDIVLAVTGGVGGLNLRGAVAVTDRESGTGWAANLAATAKLGVVDIKGTVAYSDNAKSYTGGTNCSETLTVIALASRVALATTVSGGAATCRRPSRLAANFKAAGTISYQDGASGRRTTRRFDLDRRCGSLLLPDGPLRDRRGTALHRSGKLGLGTVGGHLRFKTHFN